jgi:hypothetical protein
MTSFEDRLWERLVDEHDADRVTIAAPRKQLNHRPVMLGGSLTAVALATVAVVLSVGGTAGTQPAYAMTQNADGTVTVSINDLATAVPELNAKFAAMGIDETVVPVEANCPASNSLGDMLLASSGASMSETFTFSRGHKYLAPGDEGVVAAEQLPNGEVAMAMEAIKPPVPTCFPATAYNAVQTGDANGVPTITMQAVTPAG